VSEKKSVSVVWENSVGIWEMQSRTCDTAVVTPSQKHPASFQLVSAAQHPAFAPV